MSKAKNTDTIWMAWHKPSGQYAPWVWGSSRQLLLRRIEDKGGFLAGEFVAKQVRITEVKPKRKARK